MQIGELLAKIARGDKLTEAELGTLRLFGNQTELNNSYVAGLQNAQSSIVANSIRTQFASFDIQPSKGILLFGTATADISTHTPVSWTSVLNTSNTSMFKVDASDNTKLVFTQGSAGSSAVCVGSVNWSGSKACAVRIEQYDSNNNSILAATYSMASYTAIVQPFCGYFTVEADAVYAKLNIFQSTTAPNAGAGARLAVFEVI